MVRFLTLMLLCGAPLLTTLAQPSLRSDRKQRSRPAPNVRKQIEPSRPDPTRDAPARRARRRVADRHQHPATTRTDRRLPEPVVKPHLAPPTAGAGTGRNTDAYAKKKKTMERRKHLPVRSARIYDRIQRREARRLGENPNVRLDRMGGVSARDNYARVRTSERKKPERAAARAADYQGRRTVGRARKQNEETHYSVAYQGQQRARSSDARTRYHARRRWWLPRDGRHFNAPHERARPVKPRYDKSERSIWND